MKLFAATVFATFVVAQVPLQRSQAFGPQVFAPQQAFAPQAFAPRFAPQRSQAFAPLAAPIAPVAPAKPTAAAPAAPAAPAEPAAPAKPKSTWEAEWKHDAAQQIWRASSLEAVNNFNTADALKLARQQSYFAQVEPRRVPAYIAERKIAEHVRDQRAAGKPIDQDFIYGQQLVRDQAYASANSRLFEGITGQGLKTPGTLGAFFFAQQAAIAREKAEIDYDAAMKKLRGDQKMDQKAKADAADLLDFELQAASDLATAGMMYVVGQKELGDLLWMTSAQANADRLGRMADKAYADYQKDPSEKNLIAAQKAEISASSAENYKVLRTAHALKLGKSSDYTDFYVHRGDSKSRDLAEIGLYEAYLP